MKLGTHNSDCKLKDGFQCQSIINKDVMYLGSTAANKIYLTNRIKLGTRNHDAKLQKDAGN